MKPVRLSLLALILTACTSNTDQLGALDPAADQACELDGMLLRDYPGPKGQIRFADGRTEFYCDTIELLAVTLAGEQVRKVGGVFVQDMAQSTWEAPTGHWIDAHHAFYVQGSSRTGSMGPTLASFADRASAEGFARQYGGQVLAFTEITLDMVDLDGAASHDVHG